LNTSKQLASGLLDGQRAFASVAYDRQPVTTPEQEAMFGFRGSVPERCYRTIGAVVGARGGKSYTLVAIRLLWGMLTRDLSSLAPGEVGVALVVAPDLRLSRQVVNYARGALQRRPELAALIEADSELELLLRLPGGKRVALQGLPATRGGSAVRGRSLIDAALDEACFFRDAGDGYVVNDTDIYTAVAPRVMPGGQVIIASTPWAESGLLYDLWAQNYGHPTTALVAHAPTLALNNSPWVQEQIAIERARDPENARREYDAEFMSSTTLGFFDGNAIKQSTSDYALGETYQGRLRYAAAADFGFKSDSSALVIVCYDGERYRQVYEDEVRPEPGKPLVPSEVVSRFASAAKAYGCRHIIADGHYSQAIAEHLRAHEIALIESPGGIQGKLATHNRAKAVLQEGRCMLSAEGDCHRQLKDVLRKNQPGGQVSIYVKRKPGKGHGDIASAWVLAIHYLATAQVDAEKPKVPAYGTPAFEAYLAEKSVAAMLDADMKAYGKRGANDW